jgi:hypothetical protein
MLQQILAMRTCVHEAKAHDGASFSGTDLLSTSLSMRPLATSTSVRTPLFRMPVAPSTPALMYSSDE